MKFAQIMEKKIYSINNTDFLTLDGSKTAVKVLQDKAYLFAVKKLKNGLTGARNEISVFEKDGICPNIPPSEEYIFILTGTNLTQVEVIDSTEETESQAVEIQSASVSSLKKSEEEFVLRAEKQKKLTDESYSRTILNIASVTDPKITHHSEYNSEDSAIVRVFKIIASKNDLKVTNTDLNVYSSDKTGFQQLAKDNTIRVREVVLRDKWYKHDNGHLMGFYSPNAEVQLGEQTDLEKDFVPVALVLKDDCSGYVAINPADGTEIPVSGKNADHFYPMAFMTYKNFQEEKISLKSICRFVLKDIYKDLARVLVISLLCTLIGLIIPEITRNFVDNVIPNAARNTAIQICIIVFVCNLSSFAGSLAKYFADMRMETKANSDLSAALTDRILRLPVDFFKNYSAGELSSRMGQISQIRSTIFNIVVSVGMNFLFSFIYLLQELRFSPYLTRWGFLFCLVPVLISVITCFATYSLKVKLINCQGKISGMLFGFLSGSQKITNSAAEKQVFQKWSEEYIKQVKYSYSIAKFGNVISLITTVFPTFVSMAFYFLFGKAFGTKQVEGLSTGTFMGFLAAFGSFQGAFLGIISALLSIRDLIPEIKFIQPILEEKPEIDDSKPAIGKIKGKIEISHLNFRYSPNSPLILNDVSMNVNPGEFIAVVGASGAGKSTLLRLLLGFEKAESGSIFIDDQDLSTFEIGSFRRQLGVVLQKDSVLEGTVLQNIVGSTGLKEKDAWAAAEKVAFDRDVKNMPMGMFTMIPAGGSTLSGGQLQRLIIARAIVRNPKLLIFDEATSALDNITQQTVTESLDNLNVTRIVIAHRLSTIINADRIYVLKEGRIVESGSYEELMKLDGYFAQLASRQQV